MSYEIKSPVLKEFAGLMNATSGDGKFDYRSYLWDQTRTADQGHSWKELIADFETMPGEDFLKKYDDSYSWSENTSMAEVYARAMRVKLLYDKAIKRIEEIDVKISYLTA